MSYIGEATHKGKLIMVSRDEHGKFFISVNGQRVGVKLNATEMCRWFLNAMHSEPELNADGKPRMSKEELHKQIKELHIGGYKISAVKLVRIELCCGLREALDYCNKVWNE